MEKCKHAIIFQDIQIQDLNSGWVLLHAGATWKSHHSLVGSGQGGFLSGQGPIYTLPCLTSLVLKLKLGEWTTSI